MIVAGSRSPKERDTALRVCLAFEQVEFMHKESPLFMQASVPMGDEMTPQLSTS
jgi:hypothetical protein